MEMGPMETDRKGRSLTRDSSRAARSASHGAACPPGERTIIITMLIPLPSTSTLSPLAASPPSISNNKIRSQIDNSYLKTTFIRAGYQCSSCELSSSTTGLSVVILSKTCTQRMKWSRRWLQGLSDLNLDSRASFERPELHQPWRLREAMRGRQFERT
eukprot:1410224-Pleurochrysis_carterae.AAC.1